MKLFDHSEKNKKEIALTRQITKETFTGYACTAANGGANGAGVLSLMFATFGWKILNETQLPYNNPNICYDLIRFSLRTSARVSIPLATFCLWGSLVNKAKEFKHSSGVHHEKAEALSEELEHIKSPKQ